MVFKMMARGMWNSFGLNYSKFGDLFIWIKYNMCRCYIRLYSV